MMHSTKTRSHHSFGAINNILTVRAFRDVPLSYPSMETHLGYRYVRLPGTTDRVRTGRIFMQVQGKWKVVHFWQVRQDRVFHVEKWNSRPFGDAFWILPGKGGKRTKKFCIGSLLLGSYSSTWRQAIALCGLGPSGRLNRTQGEENLMLEGPGSHGRERQVY
jgi:hypothetical protein